METPSATAVSNPTTTTPSSASAPEFEYRQHDALGLADLVRRGETSASELLDLAIARAEAVNPKINAIITPLYDYGRAQINAGLPDGPFSGVPLTERPPARRRNTAEQRQQCVKRPYFTPRQ